ncbi:MAG: YraN family protein [Actinomycetes bacterium]
MRGTDAVGRYGERVAVDHLQRAGLVVLARNWRGHRGELDIVALDGECIVAVEVKTRRSLAFGHPVEAVTRAKAIRLRRLLAQWLEEHDHRSEDIRVDLVGVVRPRSGPAEVLHLRGVA